MATVKINANLGPDKGGRSTVGYTIEGSLRSTAGVTEMGTNTGCYEAQVTVADGFYGSVLWDTGDVSPRSAPDVIDLSRDAYPLDSGAAQGGSANTITLAATAPSFDLTGCVIFLVAHTGSGQAAVIQAYDTTTKVVTPRVPWLAGQQPVAGTLYTVLGPEDRQGYGLAAGSVAAGTFAPGTTLPAVASVVAPVTVATNLDKTGYALSGFGFTVAATLAASQPNYAPAKAGDAMALTAGERAAVATAVGTDVTDTLGADVVALKVVSDHLATGLQADGFGGYQFTARSLALAPTGSGGSAGATLAQIQGELTTRGLTSAFTTLVGTNLDVPVSGRLPTSAYVAPDNADIAAIRATIGVAGGGLTAVGYNGPSPATIAAAVGSDTADIIGASVLSIKATIGVAGAGLTAVGYTGPTTGQIAAAVGSDVADTIGADVVSIKNTIGVAGAGLTGLPFTGPTAPQIVTALDSTSTMLLAILNAAESITSNTARMVAAVPSQMVIPGAGSTAYEEDLILFDLSGVNEAADAGSPTVHVRNAAGTSRDGHLSATVMPAVGGTTGRYRVTYTVQSTDAAEQLFLDFTAVVGGVSRTVTYPTTAGTSFAATFDTSDRATLDAIAAQAARLQFDGSNFVKSDPQTAVTVGILNDKTGLSLAPVQVFSTTGSVGSVTGAVGSVTAAVTVGTLNDKTGMGLAPVQVFSTTGSVGSVTGPVGSVVGSVGSVVAPVTVGTNNDKTNYSLGGVQHFDNQGQVTPLPATVSGVVQAALTAVGMDNVLVEGYKLRQALGLIGSMVAGLVAGMDTNAPVFRALGSGPNGPIRGSYQTDNNGNRLAGSVTPEA